MLRKLVEVGFVDLKDSNGGDCRLAQSAKFKDAALDWKDVGAAIEAIENATPDVK